MPGTKEVSGDMVDRDEPTGALVRPYAVTRGRTRPRLDIALEALVETTVRGRAAAGGNGGQGREHQYIAAGKVGGSLLPHSVCEYPQRQSRSA